jgi:ribose/xylose/arabinose/galactoside ABC-type transport system permease subunit
MQRALITIGVAVLLTGLLWPWLSKLGLGRLPGDFRIQTGNSVFYFPLATCLIVSLALSAVIWLLRR